MQTNSAEIRENIVASVVDIIFRGGNLIPCIEKTGETLLMASMTEIALK
jgi:hypothetical protein